MNAAGSAAEQNKNLVLGALGAVTQGDTDSFLEAMHPELVVHEPGYLPFGGEHRGAEGFLGLFAEITKLVDVPTLELLSATADEERVVLLMTVELLNSGERRYLTEHWRIEDGKVREVRVFWSDLPE
jgi:ketosteroid isomerase-like protein